MADHILLSLHVFVCHKTQTYLTFKSEMAKQVMHNRIPISLDVSRSTTEPTSLMYFDIQIFVVSINFAGGKRVVMYSKNYFRVYPEDNTTFSQLFTPESEKKRVIKLYT